MVIALSPWMLSPSTIAFGDLPWVVWLIAGLAAALLTATWWLLRWTRRRRVGAAVTCITISLALHALLFFLVPLAPQPGGGTPQGDGELPEVVADVTWGEFDPELPRATTAAPETPSPIAPLPLPTTPLVSAPPLDEPSVRQVDHENAAAEDTAEDAAVTPPAEAPSPAPAAETKVASPSLAELSEPSSLAEAPSEARDPGLDAMISSLLFPDEPTAGEDPIASPPSANPDRTSEEAASPSVPATAPASAATATVSAPPQTVINQEASDFAQRNGSAKQAALARTGGDAETEAAVAQALRWLAETQAADGSWNPRASGAGQERAPLGLRRDAAGKQATSGITGLALLAMLGAGNTHREGAHGPAVFAGLSYLIRSQAPDGSLAGEAGTFARTYSHGMAALALSEAAAMTGDPQALDAAKAAIAYTVRVQHPVTGGWRYVPRDPGDLSQLGWQAMVLESGRRAGIAIPDATRRGIFRFLESVRGGRHGGLASYRSGERPTATMTAEALATRLLLGEPLPQAAVREAEAQLQAQPPGVGQPNFYYWYYASLALHQLQDDAWQEWNRQLKATLLATQQADGSWPTDSVWGGYGGRVYTTAMAALCLEVYYRHATPSPQRARGPANPQR